VPGRRPGRLGKAKAARRRLGTKSLEYKLPTIYQYRDFVAAGGVMSYGGDIKDSYHQAGIYAGRILNGENGKLPSITP
jgi:ABC-type uncharacterized transport system substrate-binding protein